MSIAAIENLNNITTRFQVRVTLTEKEKEIIYLIAHEHSDKEIGQKLFLSHHTIHTYRKNLMVKLDVRKSTGIVRRGFQLGILSL